MKTNKKIAVFGCKDTTRFLIDSLKSCLAIDYIITISPKKNLKINIPDYCDLKSHYRKTKIQVYHVNRYDLKNIEDTSHIKKLNIDIAFVIGWQRLIPLEILHSISIGCFGMHGSSENLPKGRGRSPMNWSLIEGREIFYTNIFKYEAGVDNGDILDTIKFSINNKDNAETMHFKNMLAMKTLIIKNLSDLISNKIKLSLQKKTKPTYYPKRNPEDSQIDWSNNITEIERFVRAVSKPFNGAFSYLKSNLITIYSAQVFDYLEFKYEDRCNGEIVEVFNLDKFLIKCDGGCLLINSFECRVLPKVGDILKTNYSKLKIFKTNKNGHYDL